MSPGNSVGSKNENCTFDEAAACVENVALNSFGSRQFLRFDVIEAVEGPFVVSLCGGGKEHESCRMTRACTMYGVWQRGQERMLQVYRSATLDQLAMAELRPSPPRAP